MYGIELLRACCRPGSRQESVATGPADVMEAGTVTEVTKGLTFSLTARVICVE
jgi:hypothetical protein